ncbi:MAG TPA: hypothetical protein VFV67_20225 [Actinophytocola sp.]|uniref:LolA family protein n=1 Tax=Actinophytocola sp. TaxID=1872138 RepID=UPI002DBCF3D2|nr:hypothetical protein [Actinophytocola sp.]HEU5472979.1 hypothetical protein [Actinophytocola sp.]
MRRGILGATLAIGMAGILIAAPVSAVAGPDGHTGADRARPEQSSIVALSAVERISRSVAGPDGRPQTTQETNKLYRDGQGRTRLESGSTVTITDPVAKTTVRLDTKTGVFTRSAGAQRPDAGQASPATVQRQQLSSAPRSLGTATVGGVRAEGSARTVTLNRDNAKPIASEVTTWLARDIQLAVRTQVVDAAGARYEKTYTDIRTGVSLAADLFTVPAGYRAADPTAVAAVDCPVAVVPNPLFIDSFGPFLGAGFQAGVTDFPNAACLIVNSAAIVESPLWAVDTTPLGLPFFEWFFFDTGLPVPFLPWTAFGASCYQAANLEDTTEACGLVILTVWP